MTKVTFVNEVTFPSFKGGVERWFDYLSKFLASQKIEVSYLNFQNYNLKRNNVQFISLPKSSGAFHISGNRNFFNIVLFSKAIYFYFKRNDPEIIYLTSYPFLHLLLIRIVKIFKRQKMIVVCDWFEFPTFDYWKENFNPFSARLGYFLQHLSVKVPDVIFTYMDSTNQIITSKLCKKQKIYKLPGICFPELTDLPAPIFKPSQNIYFLGRLTADKQPILALRVAKELMKKGWRGKLFIIGSGPLKQEVNHFILQNNLQENAVLLENMNDSDVIRIAQSCGALIHPSKREGFGLAVVEAAVLGKPSILIKNENNNSSELEINPRLVAYSNNPKELAQLTELALIEGEIFYKECLTWKNIKSCKFSALTSATIIASILKELSQNLKKL